jgi:subfamily B ATP-binding cassette protein HlyB/CyaB
LILQADAANALVVEADDDAPRTLPLAEFCLRYSGHITRVTPQADSAADADSEAQARQARKFGFGWFIPELR